MRRLREPELMDDPALPAAEHGSALRALDRINGLLGMDRRRIRALRQFGDLAQLSVLDVGAGGGGFLGRLHRSNRNGATPRRIGLDRAEFAVADARRRQPAGLEFVVGDALAIPLASDAVDVCTCALFLHHFDETDVVRILREMGRVARRGLVISDLERSTLAWAGTWAATRALSRSRVFHTDGPRSVRAAFRASELRAIAEQAGLQGARVQRVFPFHMLLTWIKAGRTP